MSLEFIISFVLTLLVFSYILGDNWLYRVALYIFVGVVSAYTAIITIEGVILPLLNGDAFNAVLVVSAAVLTALLLLKPIPLFTPISNLAFGFLIAVGSAVAVLGAITGTILPFIGEIAYIRGNSLLNAVVMFVGVVSSLLYFQYIARRQPDNSIKRGRLMGFVARIGEGFIAITLGAVYAGAVLSSLTVLSGHISRLLAGG